MELIRTNNKGDVMFPREFQIFTKNAGEWDNPLINIFSACKDSRDGEIYTPTTNYVDRTSVMDIVNRGIWTPQEAQIVIGLILKAYVLIGEPVEEPIVEEPIVEELVVDNPVNEDPVTEPTNEEELESSVYQTPPEEGSPV